MLQAYFNLFAKSIQLAKDFSNPILDALKGVAGQSTNGRGGPELNADGWSLFVRSDDRDGTREIWDRPDGVRVQTLNGEAEQFFWNGQCWPANQEPAASWFCEGVTAGQRQAIELEMLESPYGPNADGKTLAIEIWADPVRGEVPRTVLVDGAGVRTSVGPDAAGQGWSSDELDRLGAESAYRARLAARGEASLERRHHDRLIAAIEMGHLTRFAPDYDGGPELSYAVVFVKGKPSARAPEKAGDDGVVEYFTAQDLRAVVRDPAIAGTRVGRDAAAALGGLEDEEPANSLHAQLSLSPG